MKTTRIILGLTLTALPALVQAQGAAKLTAEQILDKSIQASGGRAAYAKIKSSSLKGTLNVKTSGIKGSVEILTKSPNKILVVTTMGSVGETRQGFDGKVGWSKDPFTGLRKLEGNELEEVKRQAQFNEELNYKTLYSQVKLIGMQKVNGKDAYAIKMTPKKGKPSTSYFDTKTFLLLKQDMISDTPQGTFAVQSFTNEYKTVDGVKFPTVIQQKIGNVAEVEMRFSEIKNNVPVDDKAFVMPAK